MWIRLTLIGLLLCFDLLVLPTAIRIPLGIPGEVRPAAARLWSAASLCSPLCSVMSLIGPATDTDRTVRRSWLGLQGLAAAACYWLVTYRRRGDRGIPQPVGSGLHGTARWRTEGALANTLFGVPLSVRSAPPLSGIVAGVDRPIRPRKGWLIPGPGFTPGAGKAGTNPHVLVLGGSGSGKTRRLVLPNLWLLGRATRSGSPNSIVVTDPKGELYSFTAGYFRSLGYQVRTLNLIDPKRSDRYNPLVGVTQALDEGDRVRAAQAALDLAHIFAAMDDDSNSRREDPFWQHSAESLIAAVVYYVAAHAPPDQRTMASVYRMVAEGGKSEGIRLNALFDSIADPTDPARMFYGTVEVAPEKVRAGVYTTAAVFLRLFAEPTVEAMTAVSDYAFAEIGRRPTITYLLLPDDNSTRSAIAVCYLMQMYAELTKLSAASPKGRLPVPVYWVLDEFANIGRFKDFDKMISVMRGRGMAAVIVLQALQQLDAKYGPETARVITANCDTWLFLRTNDAETAEIISKKLGQFTTHTVADNTTRQQNTFSSGSTVSAAGRALLTADEVLRWPSGQVLVMQGGQFPARLSLADLSQWPVQFAEGGPPPERVDGGVPAVWLPPQWDRLHQGAGRPVDGLAEK